MASSTPKQEPSKNESHVLIIDGYCFGYTRVVLIPINFALLHKL
jgi:hypothetical protein